MDFTALFKTLERLLIRHRTFWQLQAFDCIGNPWPQQPDLWRQLHKLPEPTTLSSHQRATLLSPWITAADDLLLLCTLPELTLTVPVITNALSHSIPGHKWQQILPLAALVPPGQHVIEWCSGHGHLGRVLAATGARSVTSLERDADLCHRGRALAERAGVSMNFHTVDVLDDQSTAALLRRSTHAVALHACGDLHTTLLHHSAHLPLQGLTIAPCCYHLTCEQNYQALSQYGRQNALQLSRTDLRLAVKQTTTSSKAQRQRARTEVSWRLGFDCLQRELRAVDTYLPLPAIPRQLLRSNFADFAYWATRRKGLTLPAQADLRRFEHLGTQRYADVRRIEWVQQLFARALELWLLLDRALFLQQHGYQVTIGEFCDSVITPRNLVICAHR